MARQGSVSLRNKQRTFSDVCADCGNQDPAWASINRGILICDECCSVHRSLGRHISQVKSLKNDKWQPNVLAMVHKLNASGANNIWEYTLLDPGVAKANKRRPSPSDPVHPNKAEFIRAKHQLLSYVCRTSKDDSGPEQDYSKELHSSVRTANLETSLRLLSLGADPNYFHKEKGTCTLHVAAGAGQSLQVELLMVYGADPGIKDPDGKTPVEYAQGAEYNALAERLIECQYELTDRLSFYLSGHKPDHSNNQHWMIPDMPEASTNCEHSKEAILRLINLPNHLFEELACDVYDEVDRRETESLWLSLQNPSALVSDRCTVPFLPVNPDFSATRNQGRQKLARLIAKEFTTLIIDILCEAKRRSTGSYSSTANIEKEDEESKTALVQKFQHLASTNNNINSYSNLNDKYGSASNLTPHNLLFQRQALQQVRQTQSCCHITPTTITPPLAQATALSNTQSTPSSIHDIAGPSASTDEEPLYDSVASEDDYSTIESIQKLQQQQEILKQQSKSMMCREEDYVEVAKAETLSKNNELHGSEGINSLVSYEEYLEMRNKLESSEARIRQLQENNTSMKEQLDQLTTTVHKLFQERSVPQPTPLHNKVKTLSDENSSLRSLYHPSSDRWGSNLIDSINSGSLSSSPLHQSHLSHGGPHSVSGSPRHQYYTPASYSNGELPPHASSRYNSSLLKECGSYKYQRPFSMFEPRQVPPCTSNPPSSLHGLTTNFHNMSPTDDHDNGRRSSSGGSGDSPVGGESEFTPLDSYQAPLSQMPIPDQVVMKTQIITRRIQELLVSAQETRLDDFVPCSENINGAVQEMAQLFPMDKCHPGLQKAVHELVKSAARLHMECRNHMASQLHTLDPKMVTQIVIQCAYDIANAAKHLVAYFESD